MLTKTLQLQYLGELISKEELSPVDLSQFDEPYRTCYRTMADVNPVDAYHECVQRVLNMPTWDEDWEPRESLLAQIRAAADSPLIYPSLEELAKGLPPITWLWKNWIPRGMLSLFGAVPGAGKSYMALDLARRVLSPGQTFPDGSGIPNPGGIVIYVDAEVIPQIIAARAKAWNMDMSNLNLMLPKKYDYIDLTRGSDQDNLITMTHVLRPELIIVDSLSSISTKGENSVEDVRAVLSFLAQLADDYQCGILLIHHLRKRNPAAILHTVSMDDFRGSGHIVAMSRSVLGLSIIQESADQDKHAPRQLEIVKTNLGPYPNPLGARIQSIKDNPDYAEIIYGKAPVPYREPTKVELCSDWLMDLLEDSDPLKPQEILIMARDDGFSRAAVYRAKEYLGDRLATTGNRRDPMQRWGTPESVESWKQDQTEDQDQGQPQKTKLESCSDWLLGALNDADGIHSKKLREMAKGEGFGKDLVYKAKNGLDGQVISTNGVWSLVEK